MNIVESWAKAKAEAGGHARRIASLIRDAIQGVKDGCGQDICSSDVARAICPDSIFWAIVPETGLPAGPYDRGQVTVPCPTSPFDVRNHCVLKLSAVRNYNAAMANLTPEMVRNIVERVLAESALSK